MLDFGTYPMSIIRSVLRSEPSDLSAKPRVVEFPGIKDGEDVDEAIQVRFDTKSGAVGSMFADLRATCQAGFLPESWKKLIPGFGLPKCEVECLEREFESPTEPRSAATTNSCGRCFVKRRITFWNYIMPSIYHRIDIEDEYVVRQKDQVLRRWKDVQYVNAYTWPNGDERGNGREKVWWTTYFYQLEEFINRIKGRRGSGIWIDGEESIKQMEAIDLVYEKAGMKVRPSTGFQL